MKKMCKEEVEKVEGNIEEGNDVEAKKEDNDDEWGPKKGQEAEEGKDDVKVEFEKYPEDKSDYGGKKPWADKAAHDEKSENNDKEKKVVMGYEKEKI